MENDEFLRTLCGIIFDKDQLKQLHKGVTNCYSDLLHRVDTTTLSLDRTTGALGTKTASLDPTTDNTDWNKRFNVCKLQLKLLSMLYEYKNNWDGTEAISFTTMKIVDDDGQLINVKRNQQAGDDGVRTNRTYSCPNCQINITAEVQQKRECAADCQFYFCNACEHLFRDEHLE